MKNDPTSANREYSINFTLNGKSSAALKAHVVRPDWLYGTTFLRVCVARPLAGMQAVHPLSGANLPIVADASLKAGEVALGVPVHDATSRALAEQHELPGMPVIAQDFGEPLTEAKDVYGVVVIGYDPQTGKFMGLKHGELGWLVGGGREDGESYKESAQRELAEEAGHERAIAWIELGDPIYSYYYNDIKRSNRRSLGYNYLAILDSTTPTQQRQEAHEDFTVQWVDFDELYKDITNTGGGVGHWLEALRRARDAATAYQAGRPYQPAPYGGEGVLINSGPYNGLDSELGRQRIMEDLRLRGNATI
jgi:8-oxo-dGTP pyrophosphatase MutT (NUDIX family)